VRQRDDLGLGTVSFFVINLNIQTHTDTYIHIHTDTHTQTHTVPSHPMGLLGTSPDHGISCSDSSLLYLGKAPSLDCAMQGGTLWVCIMGDEVNPCVATQGDTLQEVKGSKRCI